MTTEAVNPELMKTTIELLESGDDEGCDGLVVVSLSSFLHLRKLVKTLTGQEYGSVSQTDADADDQEAA